MVEKLRSFSFLGIALTMLILISSCNGQDKSRAKLEITSEHSEASTDLPAEGQIAQYVRNIHQDKMGNYWFGTNGYGTAHFDGNKISYYSISEGFGGQQITGMAEDQTGNIWFATDQGVVQYIATNSKKHSKKQFTNFNRDQFFEGQRLWSICVDSKGNVWAGGERSIFKYVGGIWAPFKLPYPTEVNGDFITLGTTWSIMEDHSGNMWFSTNGFGAFKFDGESFTQYTEEDGLSNNNVDQILEDKNGSIWFGTRFGGISRFDRKVFTNFNARGEAIGNDEVCVVFEDSQGNIWFSSEGYGIYKYDGKNLTNFSEEQGLMVGAVQTIFEDSNGTLWTGGGGGLYKKEGETFINVKRDGPWE